MSRNGMFLSEGVAGLVYLLSGVVFPLGVLPKWVQPISLCLPTTYWLEGMRRALMGPVPDRLRDIRASRRGVRYAIAAAWFVAGAALGWLAHEFGGDRPPSRPSFARQAAVAHAGYSPEVRHPVEVGAAEQEHLVNWLSKRLGAKLRAPLLTREGYELVGGRLLPGDSGAVAQFMYQDANGRRLTLYVSTDVQNRDTAFRYAREGEVHVFYWIDQTLGYALAGDAGKEEMLRVARAVYEQFNP